MSETKEATGRTLEEAKRAAAEALGLSVDECEFEVIEGNTKGLFAKSNYRVKARAKAGMTQEPEAPVRAAVHAPVEEVTPASGESPLLTSPASGGGSKEVSGGGSKEVSGGGSKEASGGGIGKEEEVVSNEDEVVANEEDAAAAKEMLEGLFKAAGLAMSAEVVSLTGKYVNVNLVGKDAAGLTEDRGMVLDSLQYLANAMFARSHGTGARLTLDAESYREERAAALEKLARDVAAAVIERQQEAVLDALPAHERRVIHSVLKDIEGIETYSEGEEPERRVVITPSRES